MPYKDIEKRRAAVRKSLRKAYAANPEKEKLRVKKWKTQNPQLVKLYKHTEYENHKADYAQYTKEWRAANPEKARAQGRSYVLNLKLDIIAGYGGECVCCGDKNWEFLTIDHIHGGGKQHRLVERARDFYIRLRREGFPRGEYRLLCINCNFALGMYGYCPHQKINRPKPISEQVDSNTPVSEGEQPSLESSA